jgi:hypothetical protein
MSDDARARTAEAGERGLEAHLESHGHLWLAALCVSAFLLTYLAPVDASMSDPWGTLLTAQSILEHGTIRLDAYAADVRWDYRRMPPAANGHVYDYFPIGTSILALPAVALARLRGRDMIYPEDNQALQNSLSSLTVVAAALLTWALCRRFLPRSASLAVSAAFVFGSSIASTLGSALWSTDLALVLGLACTLWIASSPPRRLGAGAELALGALVFMAYLCRPTMALLAPLLAAYLWAAGRRFPGVFVATVAGLSALFMLFTWRESGTLLPPYYQPGRLGTRRFSQALVGHLLSPSRGLLVGSPFLLLPLAGLAIWPERLARDRLVRLALAWIGLHWITISLFHNWWGGWSFGSRLFADALPAFLLLTVRVAAVARDRLSPAGRRAAGAAFLAFAAFAAFVHSHQGLYNVHAMVWNDGIDASGPARVFDWRYPQFLASPRSLGAHAREQVLLASQAVAAGEALLPESGKAVFEGWSSPEGQGAWRWSKSRRARVLFKAARSLGEARELVLEIEAGTYQPQVVEIRLNGAAVGTMRSERDWEPAIYRFELGAEALARAREPLPGVRLFELELEVPGAVLVDEGPYQRWLGVCLRRLTFSVPGGRAG